MNPIKHAFSQIAIHAADFLRDAVPRLRQDVAKTPPAQANSRTLSDTTMAALGLERQPFTDHPSPSELFVDDAIEMQLNMLAEQIRKGEMLPVLRGESGSGRTSIIILLLQRLSEEQHIFVARGDADLRATRVIMDMLRILVRPIPKRPVECYQLLCKQLAQLTDEGSTATLVIDDAHRIPRAELQNLLTMHDHLSRKLAGQFRLLLAADPSIEHTLSEIESRQITSGQVSTANLRPLSGPRVGPYLTHRLNMAGCALAQPLDEAAINRIAQRAAGLPRAVESAAAQELEYTYGN